MIFFFMEVTESRKAVSPAAPQGGRTVSSFTGRAERRLKAQWQIIPPSFQTIKDCCLPTPTPAPLTGRTRMAGGGLGRPRLREFFPPNSSPQAKIPARQLDPRAEKHAGEREYAGPSQRQPFFQSLKSFLDRVTHERNTEGRLSKEGSGLQVSKGRGCSLFLVPGQLPGCETNWFLLPAEGHRAGSEADGHPPKVIYRVFRSFSRSH